MSDSVELETTISALNRRRRFLTTIALATAGVSAAPLLPAVSRDERSASAKTPKNCADARAPMKDVAGKVAFITGGSSGIGLGIARAFADAGMKLVIGYRTEKHLDETMKYFEKAANRVHPIRVDVTDRAAMEKAAAETTQAFGKVHVLVNNAGVTALAPLSRTTYEEWDWVMGVNLGGVFNGIHAFLPRIREHGEGGHVITISSVLGLFSAGGGQGAYCTSKFAVVGMMEALRADLADTSVGVSVCCPGVVKSNLADSNRNRLADEAIGSSKVDSEMNVAKAAMKGSPIPTDPMDVGRLVLQGMRRNDLYILTHPEFEPIIQRRNLALTTATPTDLRPTEVRLAMADSILRSSIYTVEWDRSRCAREGRK